jgi:hypothetical protein
MAWNISFFPKYLRSPEEFRKILVSKFLLNLLERISKTLVNSKIQFLIQKSFCLFISRSARQALLAHLAFGPARPTGLTSPTGRSPPRCPIRPVCRWRLSSWSHSLSSLSVKWTPAVSSVSHPAPPSSAPRMAASRLNSPHHQDPLLNPPLNLVVFNGIKDINATVTPPPSNPSLACPWPL